MLPRSWSRSPQGTAEYCTAARPATSLKRKPCLHPTLDCISSGPIMHMAFAGQACVSGRRCPGGLVCPSAHQPLACRTCCTSRTSPTAPASSQGVCLCSVHLLRQKCGNAAHPPDRTACSASLRLRLGAAQRGTIDNDYRVRLHVRRVFQHGQACTTHIQPCPGSLGTCRAGSVGMSMSRSTRS